MKGNPRARFNIHCPYPVTTPTLASTPRASTHAHLGHKARDPELAKIGARPHAPRITAGPAATPQHSATPGPPFHLHGTSGNSFLLDYQAGLANQNRQVHAKERRRETPGKRQFRSAGKEPTPNLTSLKTRKRKTACYLNPNVLTFLFRQQSKSTQARGEVKEYPYFHIPFTEVKWAQRRTYHSHLLSRALNLHVKLSPNSIP